MAQEPAYHNRAEASVEPTPHTAYSHSPPQQFVAEHRPSPQYPPTHQHLMEHLPASSPYTTFPTPAASLANASSSKKSPPTPRMVPRVEPADMSTQDASESEWRKATELARQNPPVSPWSSSPPSPQITIQKMNTIKKNAEKKQTLACLFCRERKIACGRPSLDNPDQTCK
jgi:hypothetical protein